MNDDLMRAAITAFNAEAYRDALLAFEAHWHGERNETLRAFILLSNALNQLRLGLSEGPRRNLARAAELLDSATDLFYHSIDLATVRVYIADVRVLIANSNAVEWQCIPRLKL